MPHQPTNDLLGLDAPKAWDTDTAFTHLQAMGHCDTKRTAERRLRELQIVPEPVDAESLRDASGRVPNRLILDWLLDEARGKRRLVLFAQLHTLPTGHACLAANDARGANFWVPLATDAPQATHIESALRMLQAHAAKPISVFPSGSLTTLARACSAIDDVAMDLLYLQPVLEVPAAQPLPRTTGAARSHLDRLEAESIHILREAAAET